MTTTDVVTALALCPYALVVGLILFALGFAAKGKARK